MTDAKTVAIIDYGAGNLRSVAKAFEHVADADTHIFVTGDTAVIHHATHIVLPGVGAFADCMKGLRSLSGMIDALEEHVVRRTKPFLGICVGMQLLFERGHEHGAHEGLGWIRGEVVRLAPKDSSLKIPHMGWNELRFAAPQHPLLEGLEEGAHAYFVHSYHAVCADASDCILTTTYGEAVTAAVAKDNILGTQFHPEKSQETGLRLLKNFLTL